MNTQLEFDMDDPRLTAYALGELDASECAEIETLLAGNPEAQRFVEELRTTASMLEAGFAKEPSAELAPQQRREVLASAGKRGRPWYRIALVLSPAAAALVGVTALLVFQTTSSVESTVRLPGRMAPKGEAVAAVDAGRDDAAASTKIPAQSSPEPLSRLSQQGYLSHDRPSGAAPQSPVDADPKAAEEKKEWTKSEETSDRATVEEVLVEQSPPATLEEKIQTKLVRKAEEAQKGRALHDLDSESNESYAHLVENPFVLVRDDSRSTFSIDVDTASYSNARRFLSGGTLPPPESVRVEEFINYFTYSYPEPDRGQPFSVTTEVARCPWEPTHRLVLVGLKGRSVTYLDRKPTNLVFLIDVSGSMDSPDKLPLLVESMKLLVEQMRPEDRISIVVYAGASGLVLPTTSGNAQNEVIAALDRLQAGGSTNGGAGIELAYKVAQESLIRGGVNRVILATDGDFNVGVTSQDALVSLIEEKRKTGVFLSVLGFGTGNLKDSTMEQLADKGNGNYAYIDSLAEGRKVLVEQAGGTLETIAKDVKIQIEFNPGEVAAFRQIGYENRALAHQDFNDDTKDAGEIGAGHTVTALYEIVPRGVPFTAPGVDPSRYTEKAPESANTRPGEMMFVKLRYKEPTGDPSILLETPVKVADLEFRAASENLRFAVSAASFAMLLRRSAYLGDFTLENCLAFAQESIGADPGGYRREFLGLVRKTRELAGANLEHLKGK